MVERFYLLLKEIEDGVCIVLDEVLTEVEKVGVKKVVIKDIIEIEGLELPCEEEEVVIGKDGRLYLPV